ncbi:hypothetical protein G9A89_000674 [Geosiphon pyriformis]|nr:hypothetical protein G9A89_000674 [Geosiphon pyriformis]
MEGLSGVQRKVGRGLLINRRGMLPTNFLRHTRGWKMMEGVTGVQRKVGCGLLMNGRGMLPTNSLRHTRGWKERNVANKLLAAHQRMESLSGIQRKVGRGLLMNGRGMLPTNLLRHTRGWKVLLVFNEKLAVRNVANKPLAAHQMMEGLTGVQRKVGRGLLMNRRGMLPTNLLRHTRGWKKGNLVNKLLAAHQRMEGVSGVQRKVGCGLLIYMEEECCQQPPCGTPEDGRSIWCSTKIWPWSSYE